MFNYFNTVVAILERAKLITSEAAKKLSSELSTQIHQSNYESAVQMVKDVEAKLKDIPLVSEPWILEIKKLERRIEELEAKLLDKSIAKKK